MHCYKQSARTNTHFCAQLNLQQGSGDPERFVCLCRYKEFDEPFQRLLRDAESRAVQAKRPITMRSGPPANAKVSIYDGCALYRAA